MIGKYMTGPLSRMSIASYQIRRQIGICRESNCESVPTIKQSENTYDGIAVLSIMTWPLLTRLLKYFYILNLLKMENFQSEWQGFQDIRVFANNVGRFFGIERILSRSMETMIFASDIDDPKRLTVWFKWENSRTHIWYSVLTIPF